MQTIYLVRHQAAGIITSHAFTKPPSEEQLAPIVAECERLHGTHAKKSGEPLWVRLHEMVLIDDAQLPKFPERESGAEGAGGADMMRLVVSGVGHVVNPE